MTNAGTLMENKEEAIEAESRTLVAQCTSFAVTNDVEYEQAAQFLLDLKSRQRIITDWIAPMVRKTHEAWRAMKDRENELLKPIQEATAHVGRIMGLYQAECEKERCAQEAALRAIEREEQEAETRRLAAEYAAMGNEALADSAMEAPLPPSTVKCDDYAPKVQGTAIRTSWTFVIEDAALLPREYLMPDEKKIGGVVRAMKEATNIPGVRVVANTTVHARA